MFFVGGCENVEEAEGRRGGESDKMVNSAIWSDSDESETSSLSLLY